MTEEKPCPVEGCDATMIIAHCDGCGREIKGHDPLSLFDATERHLKHCRARKRIAAGGRP